MAQTANEAVVAVTGSLVSFPTTTTPELSAYAPNPVGSVEHGFVSEDGVVISSSRSTSNIIAWQNATNVRTVITEADITLTFTLLQTNEGNKELFYGTKKNSATGAYHWDISKTGGLRSWFVTAIDDVTGKIVKYYLPSAEVTEVGDINLTSSEVMGYEITLTAYKVDVEGTPTNIAVFEDVYPPAGS